MICLECGKEMEGMGVGDTCSGSATDGGSYAWNLYACHWCMIVARENVWDCKGVVWVYPDNNVRLETEEGGIERMRG